MAFLSSPTLRLGTSTALRTSVKPQICRPSPMHLRRTLARFRMTSTVGKLPAEKDPRTVTEDEWRQVLDRKEYNILREKGTEYPGTGEYDSFYPKEGHFQCRACGNPLYSAASKFKSGCGWPAFDKCYKGSLKTNIDGSLGMRRIEIMCNSLKYVDGTLEKEELKVV